MSLNESIVEDAALEWFGDPPLPRLRRTGLGYGFGHRPQLAPGEPAAESACALHADRRDSFGEVVQSRFAQSLIPAFSQRAKEKRGAIWGLNPAIPDEARRHVHHPSSLESKLEARS